MPFFEKIFYFFINFTGKRLRKHAGALQKTKFVLHSELSFTWWTYYFKSPTALRTRMEFTLPLRLYYRRCLFLENKVYIILESVIYVYKSKLSSNKQILVLLIRFVTCKRKLWRADSHHRRQKSDRDPGSQSGWKSLSLAKLKVLQVNTKNIKQEWARKVRSCFFVEFFHFWGGWFVTLIGLVWGSGVVRVTVVWKLYVCARLVRTIYLG